MKKINLKNDQLQIYKRENSKAWQIKLKLPRQKAIRKSSGSKIQEEAKKIALDIYKKTLINKKQEFNGGNILLNNFNCEFYEKKIDSNE